MGYFKDRKYTLEPTIVIVILLSYVFIELPIEITDSFLAYLIPFCISIIGVVICVINFRLIKHASDQYKRAIKMANIITTIIFSFLTIYNFPIPERSGLRCKNWTDIGMFINPVDNSQQYVFQSLEVSGSIYSHRHAIVKTITPLLRWHYKIKDKPQSGNWLFIDNSKGGQNACPFPLDNSKIDFERDKQKANIVTLEKGQIKNNP